MLEVQPDNGEDEEEEGESQGQETALAAGGVYRGPPDIVEVFFVNAAVLPIFRLSGHQCVLSCLKLHVFLVTRWSRV